MPLPPMPSTTTWSMSSRRGNPLRPRPDEAGRFVVLEGEERPRAGGCAPARQAAARDAAAAHAEHDDVVDAPAPRQSKNAAVERPQGDGDLFRQPRHGRE